MFRKTYDDEVEEELNAGVPVGTGIRDAMTFKTKLDRTMRECLMSIKADVHYKRNPAIIITSGFLNRGKTLNTALACKFLQKDFNPEKQIGRGIDQFIDAWKYTKSFESKSYVRCCVFDEIDEFLKGGNRKKIQEINKIFQTMKQYKIIIFLVGSNWWRLNSKIWTSGSIQGMIHILDIGEKYVHYAFYDAGDMLRILGECAKAETNDNPQAVLYNAYSRFVGSLALRGRIHKLKPSEVAYYDRISDEGKDKLQEHSEEILKELK